MHPLLMRQVKRHLNGIVPADEALKALLDAVSEAYTNIHGNLERAECVDQRLRRAVPDRVGAPQDALGSERDEQLPQHVRGFERPALMSLALSRWVEDGTALLLTGPTGSGKSWLACALAQYACRRGQSALYLRVPRLAEELRILHGNGGFTRWLAAVARTDVLLLDDWALAAMDSPTRADLMEVIDDRAGTRATIIASQLPVEHWHAWIGDASIADAILDRLLSRSHRLVLKGKSLRPQRAGAVSGTSGDTGGSDSTDAAH